MNGTVWVVNKAGVIFKWVNNAFAVFSAPFAAASVASGSNDTETWATKASDQTIWHWTGSQWVQVPGGALKVTVFSAPDPVCNDHLPVVLGGNNSIYFYQHVGGCSGGAFTFSNGGGSDLSTDFVVDATGKIDQWSAGAWHSYVTGPYGTSTKIGAWVGGIFAMSSATGAIQVIQ